MAQSTRPADSRISEAQLKVYLSTERDWQGENAKILAGTAGTANADAAAAADIAQQYQACLDRHHISRAEFDRISQAAADAWSAVAYLDGSAKAMTQQIDSALKPLDGTIAAAQQQLSRYQQAKKNGWRVLSDADRSAAVDSARDAQKSAMEEVKRLADDIAAAENDATQHESDAKSEESAAMNPPFDVSADERPEYILNKKNEAKAARASASESRVEEADFKKSQADSQAAADAAEKRADHPEIPLTDDERSEAKSDNNAAILAAQTAVHEGAEKKQKLIKEERELEATIAVMTRSVPPENIALMRAYSDQYRAQFAGTPAAATRPAGN